MWFLIYIFVIFKRYATPLDAMKLGPRETIIYVPTVPLNEKVSDYLVTINVDPTS